MTTDKYFIFTIDDKHYAISLSAVEKVIRAVELITLPKAPDMLLGLINMRGKIVPVVNIRKAFNLPEREMELDDRLIISRISEHSLAFIVNSVEGVTDSSFKIGYQHQTQHLKPLSDMEDYIEGVGKLKEKTVIIYNIHKLFPLWNLSSGICHL